MQRANILTIAGSDSGGGAGIQADLKTIMALGGYGMSVITALTAQNGLRVAGIHAPEPEFVVLELTTVLEGFPIQAAKTGMLFSAAIIEAIAPVLAERSYPLVVDPVAVSQSGCPGGNSRTGFKRAHSPGLRACHAEHPGGGNAHRRQHHVA